MSSSWQSPLRGMHVPRSPVFASLSALELAALGRLGTILSFEGDAVIFRQDENADYVYRLIQGKVRVVACSKENSAHVIRVLYSGGVLGMSASFGRAPYAASAVTCSASVIQQIPTSLFSEFVQGSSQAFTCVARALSEEYLDLLEHTGLLQLPDDAGSF